MTKLIILKKSRVLVHMYGEMLANALLVPINAKYNQTKKIQRR